MAPDPVERVWISGVSASDKGMSIELSWVDVGDSIERTLTLTQLAGSVEVSARAPWVMKRSKVQEVLAKWAEQVVPWKYGWDQEDHDG